MLKLVFAVLLGSIVGAIFTKIAVRHRLRWWPMVASMVGVVAFLLVIELSLSGSAQHLWERALTGGALASAVVNLLSKRPDRDEQLAQIR